MTVTANLYCALAAYTNRTYSAGECASAGGNAYRCTTGGTTPTTPSGTSTTPTSFGLGTSQWVWLSAITFAGTTADAVFTAAKAGATSAGGLTGSITQPIIWALWNLNGATWQTASAGTVFVALSGHSLTPTNNLTITPALGEGFRDHGSSNALAFSAANGVSFTLPATTGSTNYFEITDPNVTFDGIQFKDPDATSGSTIINLNSGANNFHLRNCIVDGTAQAGGAQLIGIASGVTGTLFTNSLIIDRQATNSNISTIKDGAASATTAAFVNCTFVAINAQNAGAPLTSNATGAAAWVVRNSVSIGYANGLLAAVTPTASLVDHDGTDATKVVNTGGTDSGGELVSQTVANMFVSSTTDFRTKAGSPFLNAGVTDATNIPTQDDIFRVARPQGVSWDMGAVEFASIFLGTLSDNPTTSDAFVAVLGFHPSALTDSATSSDALSAVFGVVTSLSDSPASSDTLTLISGTLLTLSDSAASSDSFSLTAFSTKLATDNSFTNDTYTAGFGIFTITLNDNVATTDSILPAADPFVDIFSVDFGAGVGSVIGYTSTLSDAATVSESLLSPFSVSVTLADVGLIGWVTSFTDLSSNAWTINFSFNNGQVFENGSAAGFSSNVTGILLVAGVVWQINSSGQHYTWDGTNWNPQVTGLPDGTDTYTAATFAPAATVTDSAATSETYSPTFFLGQFTAAPSDTTATGESLTGVGKGTATLPDTAALSETYSPNFNLGIFTASLSDTATTSDSFTSVLGFKATVADSATLSEIYNPVFFLGQFTAAPSDASTSSDSLNPAAAATATLSDSAISGDTLPFSASVSLADTTATSDSRTATMVAAGSCSDSTATSDAVTATATVFGFTDSATTSDALTFLRGYVTTVADTAATSDQVTETAGTLAGTLADTTATSDNTSSSGAYSGSLSNTNASSDSVTAIGFALSLSDSTTSSDSTLITGHGVPVADSAGSSDSLTAVFVSVAATPEFAASSDSFTAALSGFAGALTDSATSSDTQTPGVVAPVTATADSTTSSDMLTGLGHGAATLSDTNGFAERLSYVTFVGTLADTVATTDHLIGLTQAPLTDNSTTSEHWTNSTIGAAPVIIASVVPTGGAVLLQFPDYFPTSPRATQLTIRRSVTGSGNWTVIYQGPPVGIFIDVGDGTAAPLNPTLSYVWQAIDYSGIGISESLQPVSSYISQPDQLTQLLLRLLQGALNSMTLPKGIQKPLLTIRMPTNGWQAMPFIVVNLDLIQQTEVEIGEDVINPTPDNNWTLFANARRIWRITIMSQDSEERDFYRDSLLAIFRVLKATAFSPIGLDVAHTFQAESYSSVQDQSGVAPGFYAADLMLEINGIFPTAVLTHYPIILEIAATPTWLLNTFTETLTGDNSL